MYNFEELVKNVFRQQRCKVGHVVPMRTIEISLIDRLNPEERIACYEAIEHLISIGFCDLTDSALPCLRLTEKGYDGLYPKRTISELEDLVMGLFKDANCRVGEGVMERQLRAIEQSLNPEDSKTLIDAANNLIQEGSFIYETGPVAFLRLTQKGYDRIYKTEK